MHLEQPASDYCLASALDIVSPCGIWARPIQRDIVQNAPRVHFAVPAYYDAEGWVEEHCSRSSEIHD